MLIYRGVSLHIGLRSISHVICWLQARSSTNVPLVRPAPHEKYTLPMLQGVRSVCTTLILLLLVTYTFAVAMVQLLQNLGVNGAQE